MRQLELQLYADKRAGKGIANQATLARIFGKSAFRQRDRLVRTLMSRTSFSRRRFLSSSLLASGVTVLAPSAAADESLSSNLSISPASDRDQWLDLLERV